MPETDRAPGEHVVIRRYLTSVEADLDRAVLEANGIDARLRRDDAGGMLPALLFSMEAALLVPWQDAVRALAILEDPDSPAAAAG